MADPGASPRARRRRHSLDDGAPPPLRRAHPRHADVLLPRAAGADGGGEEFGAAAGEPRRGRNGYGRALPGAAAAGCRPDVRRGSERAPRLLARLRDDPVEHGQTRGARVRRLVRNRHGREGRLDRAPGGRARRSGQGAMGERAGREVSARPGLPLRRSECHPHARAAAPQRDPGGADRPGGRRQAGTARDPAGARPQVVLVRAARRARSGFRRDHLRPRGERASLR